HLLWARTGRRPDRRFRPGAGPDRMSRLLDGVPLVDHHCHGIVRAALDRPQFEALLTEGDGPGPLRPSLFDTQAGFGVRPICAPLLHLPRFAAPDGYPA